MKALLLVALVACNEGTLDDTGAPDDTADTADTHDHDTTDTSDTHDTGDTGHDTADTGDTAHDTGDTGHDTSDTGDTGHHDTADTGDTDTDDTGHHDTDDTDDTDTDTDTGPHDCDVEDTGFPVFEDLPDLLPLTPAGVRITERVVTEADCAWVEGCVGGLGRRRLLRFDGAVANAGDGDLAYGRPEHHPAFFEYSLCHGHHHFTDFASFDLRDGDDAVVAVGHKQAFCLLDSGRYTQDSNPSPTYDCSDQGLSSGWYDVYGGHLDCQWVDVTDVPPGDYVIRVEIDPRDLVLEADDANNVATLAVTIPSFDITRACTGADGPSLSRDCGWVQEGTGTCAAGTQVSVACNDGGTCVAGCTGDPMLRICEGDGDQCLAGGAWASNDDACASTCPRTSFLCPPSGVYTTWVSPYGATATPTCTVTTSTGAMPDPTATCGSGAGIEGDRRECGWDEGVAGTCTPGDAIWVGCDPYTCGLDVCPGDDVPDTLLGMECGGDPMLRACPGSEPCHARQALALGEDACTQQCPAAIFTCPDEGVFNVLVGPERYGFNYDCDLGYASVSEINVADTGSP